VLLFGKRGEKAWRVPENFILGGSGYLGYVDSNQGEKKPIFVGKKCTQFLGLFQPTLLTSYIQYPEPLSRLS